jgi:hypothetical protein
LEPYNGSNGFVADASMASEMPHFFPDFFPRRLNPVVKDAHLMGIGDFQRDNLVLRQFSLETSRAADFHAERFGNAYRRRGALFFVDFIIGIIASFW